MLKREFTAAFIAILMVLGLGSSATAADIRPIYELSPGMELIAEGLTLRKCTQKGRNLSFDKDDFEKTFGTSVEYITITSVPDASTGTLTFAGERITEPISFSRKNAALLRFVPSSIGGEAVFEFYPDGEAYRSASCIISVLDKPNSAPSSSALTLDAMSGVSFTRHLEVSEPDGDIFSVEVSDYPEKGVLKLDGSSFVYTAAPGVSGVDSFTYVATDLYGNSSEPVTVTLRVSEPATDTRYDDINGHWGSFAVMKMTEMGLMNGEYKDGSLMFMPEEGISRGDFLAMAMICAGLEEKIVPNAVTTFADDAMIPHNIRSYAAFAASTGLISGYTRDDGSSVFRSTNGITRAEAASILAGILGNKINNHNFSFVDAASLPDWSKSDFASLVSLGIINGTPSGSLLPNSPLTRAQAAQMLWNLCNV